MRQLANQILSKQVRAFTSRHCFVWYLVVVLLLSPSVLQPGFSQDHLAESQKKPITRSGSHPSRDRAGMTPEMRAAVEQAMGVICTEQKLDPKASAPIDHMQARPSLPVQNPEAQAGLARAQKVLPI